VRRCRIRLFSLEFNGCFQSFVPTNHAKPSQLSAGNGPLGLLAGPCSESHNRGTEEIARLPQLLRAVDTPLALDCGTFVIPFPAPRRNFVPEHRRHRRHVFKNLPKSTTNKLPTPQWAPAFKCFRVARFMLPLARPRESTGAPSGS
jgi:hypothetical protein